MPGNSGLRKREGEARKRDRRKEAAEALNHLHKFATTELQMEPISDGIREIKVRETEWSGAHVTLYFKALLLFHASPLTDDIIFFMLNFHCLGPNVIFIEYYQGVGTRLIISSSRPAGEFCWFCSLAAVDGFVFPLFCERITICVCVCVCQAGIPFRFDLCL